MVTARRLNRQQVFTGLNKRQWTPGDITNGSAFPKTRAGRDRSDNRELSVSVRSRLIRRVALLSKLCVC
jgi:hypothetical protein